MLARLRRNIFLEIRPYRMNEKELIEHSSYTIPVNDAYLAKLKKLMVIPELKDCIPCLSFVVNHKIKLEQESLID